VVGSKGHSLFLVDVFAGLNGGHEIQGVLVLRSCDEHRINRMVVKQVPKITIGPDIGDKLFHFIQAARVDIRHRDPFDIWALQGRLKDLLAAVPTANQADPNAIVCSRYTAG
jgi:hypothetical protein